jgi:hypothetical protein
MKQLAKHPIIQMFKLVFGAMLGAMSAQILVALFSLFFIGIGMSIIVSFNKKDTELFKELQTGQYVGIVICCIGLLPWIQYFFFGFLSEAGSHVFENMFD